MIWLSRVEMLFPKQLLQVRFLSVPPSKFIINPIKSNRSKQIKKNKPSSYFSLNGLNLIIFSLVGGQLEGTFFFIQSNNRGPPGYHLPAQQNAGDCIINLVNQL